MLSELLIFLLVTISLLIYFYLTRHFNHWKNKHVPYLKPTPLFGNALSMFTMRKSVGDFFRDIYVKSKEPFVGLFILDEPAILIRDLALTKRILITDFDHFNDRIAPTSHKDPIGSHVLFILKNPKWKEMRAKISPVYTAAKMKVLHKLMQESAQDVIEFLTREISSKNTHEFDLKELLSKYSTDVITSTSFGINANSFKDEDAVFRKLSRKMFDWNDFMVAVAMRCYFLAPKVVKLLGLPFLHGPSVQYLKQSFLHIMEQRKNSNFKRNDLIDILIQLGKDDSSFKLNEDLLVSQAVQFFAAGFETSTSAVMFTLYELALHQSKQSRLREELQTSWDQYDEFSYESLKEMQYLDWCLKETLRKYPILPFLDRRCTSTYRIPGTDVQIDKGTFVFVSLMGIHYNPEYFPEPHLYRPERYAEKDSTKNLMPFGQGPRNCIGERFGILSSKTAIAYILKNFKVLTCPRTESNVKMDPKGVLVSPKNSIWVKFEKIE